ncbi:MAG: DUF2231 domain-containing protein [Desulfomonilaceae bacterium]
MKNFSVKEIHASDGKDGGPALVVVQEKVYDVSNSLKWKDGSHMRRHQAGQDLTTDIKSAPHGPEVLERVQLVGLYEAEPKSYGQGVRARAEMFVEKHPFFRRHPHPAVVHFPLALLMVSSLLEIMAIVSLSEKTEWAAYLVLTIGSVSLPVAMATGYFTWWLNYGAIDGPILKHKKRLAWLAAIWCVLAFVIRSFFLSDPLNIADPLVLAYLSLVVSLSAIVATIGFLGGKLTFPYE